MPRTARLGSVICPWRPSPSPCHRWCYKLSHKPDGHSKVRASTASEPRERSAPAERRARARVGESEGRRPSDKTRTMCLPNSHTTPGGSSQRRHHEGCPQGPDVQLVERIGTVAIGTGHEVKEVPHHVRLVGKVVGSIPGSGRYGILGCDQVQSPVFRFVDQHLGILDIDLGVEGRGSAK